MGMEKASKPSAAELLEQTTVSVVDAGVILGIGKNMVYRGIRDNKIPVIQVGAYSRVSTVWLKRVLEEGRLVSFEGPPPMAGEPGPELTDIPPGTTVHQA